MSMKGRRKTIYNEARKHPLQFHFRMLSSAQSITQQMNHSVALIRQHYNNFPFNLYLGAINIATDLCRRFMGPYKE